MGGCSFFFIAHPADDLACLRKADNELQRKGDLELMLLCQESTQTFLTLSCFVKSGTVFYASEK